MDHDVEIRAEAKGVEVDGVEEVEEITGAEELKS